MQSPRIPWSVVLPVACFALALGGTLAVPLLAHRRDDAQRTAEARAVCALRFRLDATADDSLRTVDRHFECRRFLVPIPH